MLAGGRSRRERGSADGAGRTVTIERTWPVAEGVVEELTSPRDDIVLEARQDDGTFALAEGPFTAYRRQVEPVDGGAAWRETTTYRWALPWFAWLFALPLRAAIGRRGGTPGSGRSTSGRTPWWAPSDRLDPRQIKVLGLLAAASMSSAFVNTLFTQTVKFAADDFGVGDFGIGAAGSVVRAGIILVLPVAILADRIGRRRVVTAMAVLAPLITSLGALAPTFPLLVATQAVGRPIGLALDFLVAVVATEEMPRNSRAYAVSILAMASGLGAGIAVMALPLADISTSSWRFVYLVGLIWLVVAVSLARHLPETGRFERPHVVAPPLPRQRFAVLAVVALLANFFIAPASFFQNAYLEDVRGFSAVMITIFTLSTNTPAGIGLVLGGRIADVRGRRRLIAFGVPLATALVVVSFSVGGVVMWVALIAAGILGGITYPALAVYRTELFPTGNRGRAVGLLTTAALLGGIVGLLVMGSLLDRDWSHGRVMAMLAVAQLIVVAIVLRWYPETAHRELEDINPLDAPGSAPGVLLRERPG